MVLETARTSDGSSVADALRGSSNSGAGGPVLVRPTSLQPPEKEPVSFQINLIGAPPEVEQLIEHIKSVAEQFLYHWKTFPINLPTPLANSPGGGVGNGGGTAATGGGGGQSVTSLSVAGSGGGSNANIHSNVVTSGNRKTRPINLRDLFIAPPFDELDAVAADGSGEPRLLTNAQLRSLRERGLQKDKFGKPKKLNCEQLETIQFTGEFEVPSLNFPGQVHRWQLSQFLQKGSERTRDSLLSDLALSARFIVITAKERLTGHFFSFAHAFRALLQGFIKLVDMIVGVPSLLAHNLDNKIKEERCRFLVAELVCRSEYEDCLDSLCRYVRHQLRRATMEKFDVNCNQAQPIPYLYVTPKGQDIDLRLFSKDTMRRALPILVGILEKETRGWFLHFRERLIAELRERKMTDAEIEEEVNDAVMKEYLQRVYTSILSNVELTELGENIPQLLVQQAQSVVIMHKAVDKIQKELKKSREEMEQTLQEQHPVLSRVYPWLRAKLNAGEQAKLSKITWGAHEEALRAAQRLNLHQTVYFLNRDLAFMKEREPVLLKELKNAKTPTRNFQWACRIWSPKSWIIRRSFQGHSEVVPTVICQQATSIVTPRSDPSQPVFLVEKELIRSTSTRWPMWRLLNLFQRTWTWTWNIMFLLGVIVPWCSPLGLRALFCKKPFMADLELSQVNGTLFPRKTSITQTMFSRLMELWRHISKARTHFETEPDTGFIGKGMTRHLNRLYNYFIKGFLGTLVILVLFPLLCFAVSASSLALAITAPLWMPFITVTLHLYMMLIYDLDCPDESRRNRYCIFLEAVGWNIGIQGLLQPLAAVLVASIICPLIAVLVFFVGIVRYWVRLFWDAATFHLFIKKCGRVPASDSFAVRRIAGPGLALDYYFSIKPEQALAAFEAKMELDELQAYQHSMETIICQPQKDFSQFVEACFGPFSAQLSKSVGPYRQLEREGQDLMTSLHEKLEKRRRDLQTGLTTAVKSRIKLNTMELKIVIQQSAYMLEKFYPSHVIARLSISEEEFWDAKGLSVGDWAGLAGMLYADIFSLDFLTPLSDTDTQFKLEPHAQLDLNRYNEMVQNTSDIMGINGPDLLGNVYAPRGNIQVHSPYLEVSAFNPRSRVMINSRRAEKRNDTTSSGLTTPRVRARRSPMPSPKQKTQSWKPWKRKQQPKHAADKMLIPLPIPHPVHIAISIYNRDSDQPIPIESELCWEILRSIEECQGDQEAIVRFRELGDRIDGHHHHHSHPNRSVGISVDGLAAIDSSIDSLDSQNSSNSGTKDSMDMIAGATETLPCTNREVTIMMPSQVLGVDDEDDVAIDGNGRGRDDVGIDINQHGTTTNTTVIVMPSANGSGSVTTTTVATVGGGAGGAITPSSNTTAPTHFHWTLRNWGGGNGQSGAQGNRRRNTSYTYSSTTTTSGGGGQLNSGSATNSANDSQLDQIRVDLASPEDISLDTDSSRAMFTAAYGTSV
ncbi:uncharacterized protein LOC125763166 isoform X1 [Anopheles funestus]|uniref:uncharacterized protein LOC125763166 isoform X1 n=1 Tax=Anopheles funestus TaxID=62324 RepID=UPI0020C6410B|nr:uncharacterized protein LOC125763166 isoform X1 [Anopheles funestus]XP_049281970.1 uncharacterized protein LOC125763166 isoform X1 [Anopheles funestus]